MGEIEYFSAKNLDHRLETVLLHHNAIRKGLGKNVYHKDKLKEDLLKIAPDILKFAKPVWLKLDEFMEGIYALRAKANWTKDDILRMFYFLLPEFEHKETGKYLDQRM